MVVDTALTDSIMLQRLSKIKSKYKENGEESDMTRLCNSWKGALSEDKTELERLVTDPDMGLVKAGAGKVKEEHPKFRIYTTPTIQNAIGNYRRKKKEAIEKRSESKLLLSDC